MELDKLVIRGARENNLKNISLEIPRNKMVVMTDLPAPARHHLPSIPSMPKGRGAMSNR